MLIALLVVAAYANSFMGALHMDDGLRIVNNPSLRSPLSACLGTTRPLVGLSLWLNLQLGGRVADFHLFNLVIHLSSALLLYGIFRHACLLGHCSPPRSYTLAVFGAVLWGTHPVLTQAVTYIIQRAESMMGMFALLSLYCFLRAANGVAPRRWLTLSVVACALGMATKPVMLVVPLLVWLVGRQLQVPGDRWPARLRNRYFTALFGTMSVAVLLVLLPNESSSTTGMAEGLLSPWRYLLTQCEVVIHYLQLLVWPKELCMDYAWPSASGLADVWWQAVVLVAMIAVAVVGAARRNPGAFGLTAFFLLLAPSSSILPVVDAAVEHRLYLPLAGLVAALGAVICSLDRALTGKRGKGFRYIMCALGIVVAIVFVLLTRERNRDYSSVIRMAGDTVEKRPDNFRARSALVMALLDAQQFEEGERQARELVLRLEAGLEEGGVYAETGAMNARGFYPVGLNQLGRAILCRGRAAEALGYFERTLDLLPEHREAWLNMAIAHRELGDYEAAMAAVDKALEIAPDYEKAMVAREVIQGEMKGEE